MLIRLAGGKVPAYAARPSFGESLSDTRSMESRLASLFFLNKIEYSSDVNRFMNKNTAKAVGKQLKLLVRRISSRLDSFDIFQDTKMYLVT